MRKFISFGKYNKLYKYIWIYVIIRIINDYLFSETFPSQIKPNIFDSHNYPPNILVQIFFNYLATFIFSIFLNVYQKSIINEVEEKRDESPIKSDKSQKYELIFDYSVPVIKLKAVFFTAILSIISIELINVITAVGFWSILFWVFDLFFVAYTNLIMFENPIFSHKKCAIIFILIFSTLFKFLSTFEYIFDDNYNLFYKNHIILIPIISISYLFLSLIRFYSLCKIKWLLDYKFIPLRIFFIIYNFFGTIILLIPCLIASYVRCADKIKLNDIDLLCLVKKENGNNTEYYFDSFSYYFEQIWKKDRDLGLNILYLLFFLIQLLLNALRLLYSILIIRHLNPEFYLCSFGIYFFIRRFVGLIKALIDNNNIKIEVYNTIAEIVSLISIMVYLELIELNICNLNYNLKKNIENRSIDDYKIYELNEEIDDATNL